HKEADETLLLAYGGIVDARTLAAVIALGADGAVMSTRLLMSQEANLPKHEIDQAIAASGDDALEGQGPLGQGIGVIRDAPPVAQILEVLSRKAERILAHSVRSVIR
ncbi:MAG: nitronate monooxygenase, partial [Pseudomonadota bacterium]